MANGAQVVRNSQLLNVAWVVQCCQFFSVFQGTLSRLAAKEWTQICYLTQEGVIIDAYCSYSSDVNLAHLWLCLSATTVVKVEYLKFMSLIGRLQGNDVFIPWDSKSFHILFKSLLEYYLHMLLLIKQVATEFVVIRNCSTGMPLPGGDSASIQLVMGDVAEPNSVLQGGWLYDYSRIWVQAYKAIHSNLVSALGVHYGAPVLEELTRLLPGEL
jgi:hypothetical protein